MTSNEMKDWINDNKKEREENKKLIEKYPYLAVKEKYYEYTWLDNIPEGWREIALQMCEDLNEVLEENKTDFIIGQMKEKWGSLQVYCSSMPEEIYEDIQEILSEYEDLSYHTCHICGKATNRRTTGWIYPVCKEHEKGV